MSQAEIESQPALLDKRLLEALLTRATDLAQVKVVLLVARLAAEGGSSSVPLDVLLAPGNLRFLGPPGSPEPSEERARRSVERAVSDGLLCRITVKDGDVAQEYVLPGTADSVELIERLRGGVIDAGVALGLPDRGEVLIQRPNVFSLYERSIGPLSPLVAEQLREAERSYPREWLEQAIDQAIQNNARSWRYIETILRRWEVDGGPGRTGPA
jgi:DNA replication protein